MPIRKGEGFSKFNHEEYINSFLKNAEAIKKNLDCHRIENEKYILKNLKEFCFPYIAKYFNDPNLPAIFVEHYLSENLY